MSESRLTVRLGAYAGVKKVLQMQVKKLSMSFSEPEQTANDCQGNVVDITASS